MEDNKLEIWALSLLQEFENNWGKEVNEVMAGYSIFYSPVRMKPDILLIGDNPGGKEQITQTTLPRTHEYLEEKYPLACKMREKIFLGKHLTKLLLESVKINRIFFKTKNLEAFHQNKSALQIKNYCFNVVEHIIFTLKPKTIFAESFGTFRALSDVENPILRKIENHKPLLIKGTYKNIPIHGINHPSNAHFSKITNADWEIVNRKLNEIFV